MIDINTSTGIRKLHEQLNASREKVKPFRRNQRNDKLEYSGNRYAQDTSEKKDHPTIGNFIHQFVETLVLRIMGGEIKILASTPVRELKATKNRFQNALNTVSREIHLTQTSRECVFDSAFGLGIAKSYMAEGRGAELEQDVWMEVGYPCVKRVSLDNFVWDMSKTRVNECAFMADDYTLPWDAIRRDEFYEQRVVRKMVPQAGRDLNAEQRRAADLSVGILDDPVYQQEYVTLQDVWIPERGVIAILSRYDQDLPPLAVIEWIGKKEGPYDLLYLDAITDNIMPLAPLEQVQAGHMTFNRLARKVIRQAEGQKEIDWYVPTAKDDMQRVLDAADGDVIAIRNKDDIGKYEVRGANQGNLAFMSLLEAMIDRFGGNLQAKAALGPQSGTLGQDQLIHQELSGMLAQYAERVTEFNNELARGLAHLVWNDDGAEIAGELEIPGGGTVGYDWNAEYRMGNFEPDYRFSVESYSLRYKSPEAKLAELKELLAMIMELWPAFQEAGATLDPREILDECAELANNDRIKKWVRFGRDPALGAGGPARQAANTTRTNVRQNVSAGPTNEEGNRQMRDLLFAGIGEQGQSGPVSLGG